MSGSLSPGGPADGSPVGIDWSVLDTLVEDIGDREFVVETVRVYLAELPGRVGAIIGAVEQGDSEAVKAAAHSLKSSSAMLGAVGLARICRDLEAVSEPPAGGSPGPVHEVAALAAEA
ncbi:MAG TPA: Hpt domain-containing protein, partial [Actinomycetota bacterium]|nr:Hpt domain-containing protein [Actinomycetota bacterium]